MILFSVISFFYREEEGSGQFHKDYHIIFVPRKSILCESKLKVRVHSCILSVLPLLSYLQNNIFCFPDVFFSG